MGEDIKAQRRILVVQDVSGVGRCAAMVALPVLSLAGFYTALLPTALLSAHTGGFGAVHRRDLTDDMRETLRHWKRIDLRFDAVHLGYVGHPDQLDLLTQSLDGLMKPGARLYVDPVMGDGGRSYSFCGESLVKKFREICAKADLIFPNTTEAAMLLGEPLTEGINPPAPSPGRLLALGARAAIITGVFKGDDHIGVLAKKSGEAAYSTFRRRYPGAYPGTGDLLASCVIGALYRGASLDQACETACDFLDQSLRYVSLLQSEPRHGLPFELALPGLLRAFEGIGPISRQDP